MDHRRPIIRTIADAEGMHAQLLAGVADTAASAIRSRVSSDVCARTEWMSETPEQISFGYL
jgi:hypothetical protein